MSKVEELFSVVQKLPPEAVNEVLKLAQTLSAKPIAPTPYQSVHLGGLWRNVPITEEDLRQARQEMWQRFGDKKV